MPAFSSRIAPLPSQPNAPLILMMQINALVGDIAGNARRVIEACQEARAEGLEGLFVFPELSLCGYPPEDLLLRPSLQGRIESALAEIIEALPESDLLLGLPWHDGDALYNCATFLSHGKQEKIYRKRCLPNYQVFDEKRYFKAGREACIFDWQGICLGVTICEDLWQDGPVADTARAGAELLINLNASPFHMHKHASRISLVQERARSHGLAIVYVNLVGGQDELVFDGASFCVDAEGRIRLQAADFKEEIAALAVTDLLEERSVAEVPSHRLEEGEASVYQALVTGVRDYINKNHFPGVVLGLSGGIDSGLTLAIAVDALGPERVRAVMMPYTWTSTMSLEDAAEQAKLLSVQYEVVPIADMVKAFSTALDPLFTGLEADTTEENLQSRIRGTLLMALSNKTGALVLTTGNKSENAVGYATLYGDMAGGFNVLKDVYKTTVYKLANYRNRLSPAIPQRVIDRPPSAELAPDQKDADSLPPYDLLDAVLELYIEQDFSAEAIVERGFPREMVYRVLRLVDLNEYKRRQAPVGPRLTPRGFGKDRRYPITSGWQAGH